MEGGLVITEMLDDNEDIHALPESKSYPDCHSYMDPIKPIKSLEDGERLFINDLIIYSKEKRKRLNLWEYFKCL